MLIDLTPEQIVEFVKPLHFCIIFTKDGNVTKCNDIAYFQISDLDEKSRSVYFTHKYRRKFGNIPVHIHSDNPLTQTKLTQIMRNPFSFINEHPFRH